MSSFEKRKPPAGARPGTLVIPEGSPPPRIRIVDYDPGGVRQKEISDPAELRPYLESESVTWVDVQGLGDEAVLRQLGEIFSIHPLALEDAVNAPQRAKSERYEHHQLVIARMPMEEEGGRLRAPQVCFFVGRRYLLTFQERYFGFFDPVRRRIQEGVGPMRSTGPDYLAYALLDTLVDRYYPVAEQLSQAVEDLEAEILEQPGPDCLHRLYELRRELVVLRRVGWPQREATSRMVREETPFLSEAVRAYLRDTEDHIAQIMELVDSSREMAVGLSEVYLSNVSFRTNEIMKVLTLMASIFIPLTFVAGIYGMNFEFMPELSVRGAYFLVLGLMVGMAGGMVLYFRYRGWLGNPRAKPKPIDRD